MNARECAMKIIYDVEYNGAYSNLALKNGLTADMSQQDRAFASILVYGVLDRKITLDYIISEHSKLKLKKLSKYILTILRMGVYQLKFMDKIPESAAVNESVKLAKRYGHGASAGFVNGVLRSAARTAHEYPSLSVKYSFPEELSGRWTEEFGYEFTEDMLKAFGEPSRLTLRPNTLKTTAAELAKRLAENNVTAEITDDYITAAGFDIAHDAMYREGLYTVQDAAAMAASKILTPQSGGTVIDMCAAPGGKTTHMAELMGNTGRIYAFDVHEHKIEIIRKNAERLGITIIDARIGDGCEFNEKYADAADKILCDVPCSGLGIIRRKPEIKYSREDISGLPALQRKILDNASRYLKAGGEMVYSTCTIEKAENEGVTGGFLEDNANFERLYEKTFYPHIDNTDGFYICKIKRKAQ